MPYFPLFLDSHRMHALVVGGGTVAAAKLESLAGCGAKVTVVAAHVGESVRTLAAVNGIVVVERPYETADLEGKTMVVVAIDNATDSQRIAGEVRQRGLPVNVVDNPPFCDFIFPALILRGRLQIAVSSGGVSPVLARLVKQMLEIAIPKRLEALIEFANGKSAMVRAHLTTLQPRRLFWERVFRGPVAEAVMAGDALQAEARFASLLENAGNKPLAALYLIGAGPGQAEQLTLRAVRLLSQADTVFHDPRIPAALLSQYARRDAAKIALGTPDAQEPQELPAASQTQIEACWQRHEIVACLRLGEATADPPEIEWARQLGVPVERAYGIRPADAT